MITLNKNIKLTSRTRAHVKYTVWHTRFTCTKATVLGNRIVEYILL